MTIASLFNAARNWFRPKYLWWLVLGAYGILSYFGVPLPKDWETTSSWLLSVDELAAKHAVYPGQFLIFVGLAFGTVIGPEAWRLVASYLRTGPELSVKYDGAIRECKATTTFLDHVQGNCFRLQVTNLGETDVDQCEGYLVEVRHIDLPHEVGSWNLTWAIPSQSKALKLVKGVPQYLDVVAVRADGRILVGTEGRVWPLDRQNMFMEPGDYLFSIVVSGIGIRAKPKYSVILTLTGDWKTADMRPAP